MKPIGWQIVNRETDDPPKGIMLTYEIYSLDYCLAFMECQNRSEWRLLPIYKGDIDEVVDRTKLKFDPVRWW